MEATEGLVHEDGAMALRKQNPSRVSLSMLGHRFCDAPRIPRWSRLRVSTTMSRMLGCSRDNPMTRQEFLSLID